MSDDNKIQSIFSQYLRLSEERQFEEMDKLIQDFDCSGKTRHEMLAVLAITVNLKPLLNNRSNLVMRVWEALNLTMPSEEVEQFMKGLE